MSKTADQILAELATATEQTAGSHTDGFSWLLSLAADAREALGLPEPNVEHEWVKTVRPDRVMSRIREPSDYIEVCRLCKIPGTEEGDSE